MYLNGYKLDTIIFPNIVKLANYKGTIKRNALYYTRSYLKKERRKEDLKEENNKKEEG